MFCKNCGKELVEGTRYCSNCGGKVYEDNRVENLGFENPTIVHKSPNYGLLYGIFIPIYSITILISILFLFCVVLAILQNAKSILYADANGGIIMISIILCFAAIVIAESIIGMIRFLRTLNPLIMIILGGLFFAEAFVLGMFLLGAATFSDYIANTNIDFFFLIFQWIGILLAAEGGIMMFIKKKMKKNEVN